jgi:transcriptional regulator with XRE-family HTH domain
MEELETLKEIRSRYGSLRDISKQAGVSKSVLSLWERGEAPISLKGARALCEIFDAVNPYYLSSLQRIRYVVIQYENLRRRTGESKEEVSDDEQQLKKISELDLEEEDYEFDRLDLQLLKYQKQLIEVKPENDSTGETTAEIEELRFGLYGFLQKLTNIITYYGYDRRLPDINFDEGLIYLENSEFDFGDSENHRKIG